MDDPNVLSKLSYVDSDIHKIKAHVGKYLASDLMMEQLSEIQAALDDVLLTIEKVRTSEYPL